MTFPDKTKNDKTFIMSINSKLDLRLDTAKIVIQLPGTTMENFHERAHRVETYLLGEAELPETDDTYAELKKMVKHAGDMVRSHNEQESGSSVYKEPPGICLGTKGPSE